MSLSIRMAAVAMTTLALAACQTAPPPAPVAVAPPMPPPTLTAADLKATFVGNTQHGESINGVFVIYMAPNGKVHGKFDLGQDRGTWRITDDGKLCAKWRGLFRSVESCRTVQKKGDVYVMIEPQGEVAATVTVTAGNTDHL